MVCPRCIATVGDVLTQFNIAYEQIKLGEVVLNRALSADEKTRFKSALEQHGFQLLEDQKSQLIARIKAIVVNQVHYPDHRPLVNFSTLLSEELHHDYSTLSRLFSTVEGITIERFIIAQKVERIKELIVYNE
jgi:AraC-like DNA-binding protein